MYSIQIQNSELVEVFLNKELDPVLLTQHIMDKYKLTDSASTDIKKQLQKSFVGRFREKWSEACRKKTRFFEKNVTWCSNFLTLKINDEQSDNINNNASVGRPLLEFASCSDRTKQKRSSALNAQEGLPAIEHAYVQALRSTQKKPVADIVSAVSAASPKRLKRISESIAEAREVQLTTEQALALILDMDLSKHGYEMLCRYAKKQNSKMFPPYHQLEAVKIQSCPPKECLTVTATRASVPLQHLMDHTAERIIRSMTENEVIFISDSDILIK